jgi:hypothetical protein
MTVTLFIHLPAFSLSLFTLFSFYVFLNCFFLSADNIFEEGATVLTFDIVMLV